MAAVQTENPIVENIKKTCTAAIDGFYKLQEQNEKAILGAIEYNQKAREKARQAAETILTQVAENQKQLGTMINATTQKFAQLFQVPQVAKN